MFLSFLLIVFKVMGLETRSDNKEFFLEPKALRGLRAYEEKRQRKGYLWALLDGRLSLLLCYPCYDS